MICTIITISISDDEAPFPVVRKEHFIARMNLWDTSPNVDVRLLSVDCVQGLVGITGTG